MKLAKKSDEKQSINKVAEYFLNKNICKTRKEAFKKAKEANKFHFDVSFL
jgi:predicted RNA binding protein with dsRBD fold (UPF0201 family)